jgi:hypothetical protein
MLSLESLDGILMTSENCPTVSGENLTVKEHLPEGATCCDEQLSVNVLKGVDNWSA